MRTGHDLRVFKAAKSPSALLKSPEFRDFLDHALPDALQVGHRATAVIGHSRLVTNGDQSVHANNQPVVAGDCVGIHNGIVVNDDILWRRHPDLMRHAEVDTEIVLALFRSRLKETNDWGRALAAVFAEVEGTASLALFPSDSATLVLATNNGSLYTLQWETPDGDALIFASEELILRRLLQDLKLPDKVRALSPLPAGARGAWIARLDSGTAEFVDWRHAKPLPAKSNGVLPVNDATPTNWRNPAPKPGGALTPPSRAGLTRFEIDDRPIMRLRRCKRCILPETVPFITFDDEGVCNFCHSYKPVLYRGRDALEERVRHLRSSGAPRSDVLMTFSGGRDSSYGLHFAVTELGLRPVTFTYDWGMITDLARRNQARLCGKLGIEQILVSADIGRKRANIRKNLIAWLKRPSLGMIPLLMAGDKQYFKIANELARDLDLHAILLAANPYEKTSFKSGFCGLPPASGNRPSVSERWRLLAYYGKEFLLNSPYINDSLLNSAEAFFSFYGIKHEHVRIFDYVPWQEDLINRTLIEEYNWELATDTPTTWRIGDGTAAFYNYVYCLVAGFTENDSFRSNQIREGVIDRDEALRKIEVENRARFDSLLWYFSILGLDACGVLEAVCRIPRLYPAA